MNSAVGTAGALCGTFLPTLLLVPALGSRRAILVAAALQITAAASAFVVAGRPRRGAASVIGLVLPLVGWPFTDGPLRAVEGLVEERESPYQAVPVVRTEDPYRVELAQSLVVLQPFR